MKIGQITEIVTMIFLGYVLKRLGWRMTMISCVGHAARRRLCPLSAPGSGVLINLVHVSATFFFATVTFSSTSSSQHPRKALRPVRFLISARPFVTTYARAGEITVSARTRGVETQFKDIFMVPLSAALVAAVLLIGLFHRRKKW